MQLEPGTPPPLPSLHTLPPSYLFSQRSAGLPHNYNQYERRGRGSRMRRRRSSLASPCADTDRPERFFSRGRQLLSLRPARSARRRRAGKKNNSQINSRICARLSRCPSCTRMPGNPRESSTTKQKKHINQFYAQRLCRATETW